MIEKYVTQLVRQAVEPMALDVIRYFQFFYQDQISNAMAIVAAMVGLALVYLIVE